MRPARARRQGGTALLLALMMLALVATLAAAMVNRQQRALAVESAERARSQSAWVLSGALDWARLILRDDARSGKVDDLGEPWAVPLAEARLSTFLAADRESPDADEGPEAFLSGVVRDLQARLNVQNVIDGEGKPDAAQIQALQRLSKAPAWWTGPSPAFRSRCPRMWTRHGLDEMDNRILNVRYP
jgi:general secretion pathway protein K